jgi:hypothetical protein
VKTQREFSYCPAEAGRKGGPVDRKFLKEEVRRVIRRMLREEGASRRLMDVSLTLRHARSGMPVVIPMEWNDDQRDLWKLLVSFHEIPTGGRG